MHTARVSPVSLQYLSSSCCGSVPPFGGMLSRTTGAAYASPNATRTGRLPAYAQELGEADAHLELRGRQVRQRGTEHRGEVGVPRARARARVRVRVRVRI